MCQTGKTETTLDLLIKEMLSKSSSSIFVTRNYCDEESQQYYNIRDSINERDILNIQVKMIGEDGWTLDDVIKSLKANPNNDDESQIYTINVIKGYFQTYENIVNGIQQSTRLYKYMVAIDESDIYYTKDEELNIEDGKFKKALKELVKMCYTKIYISATHLDTMSLFEPSEKINVTLTEFSMPKDSNATYKIIGDKYYRSFDALTHHTLDNESETPELDAMKKIKENELYKEYLDKNLMFIIGQVHTTIREQNAEKAEEFSKDENMNHIKINGKRHNIPYITYDQDGVNMYVKGRKYDLLDMMDTNKKDIRKIISYIKSKGYKFLYIMCGKSFSRAFNVVCLHRREYIGTMIYTQKGEQNPSNMVQKSGRMCGKSKIKYMCMQHFFSTTTVYNKIKAVIDTTTNVINKLISSPNTIWSQYDFKTILIKKNRYKMSNTQFEKKCTAVSNLPSAVQIIPAHQMNPEDIAEDLNDLHLDDASTSAGPGMITDANNEWSVPEIFTGERPIDYMRRCFEDYRTFHRNIPGFFDQEYTRQELVQIFNQTVTYFGYAGRAAYHSNFETAVRNNSIQQMFKNSNGKFQFTNTN